jgi:hypothetical protein
VIALGDEERWERPNGQVPPRRRTGAAFELGWNASRQSLLERPRAAASRSGESPGVSGYGSGKALAVLAPGLASGFDSGDSEIGIAYPPGLM